MLEPRHDAAGLKARFSQWQQFARWEARREAEAERSLSEDLAWLSDALELANRLNPEPFDLEHVREKAARLARTRADLGMLGRAGA